MNEFTIDDLKRILDSCAESLSEDARTDGEISSVAFTDLGFDSLDVLEVATRLQQELGLRVPDDAITDMKTPGDMVAFVNTQMAA